jgi:hypothetical protein
VNRGRSRDDIRTTRDARGAEPRESLLHRALALVPFAPAIGLAIAAVVHFSVDGTSDWRRWLVENAVFWLVGIGGFVVASGHILTPDKVAESIGWPKDNPFQFEVGLASLSYGVLGVFATSEGPEWWLASIVAFSVFMLGAAVGHAFQMARHHNFEPGDAGAIFYYDIAAPLLLIGLYLLCRAG